MKPGDKVRRTEEHIDSGQWKYYFRTMNKDPSDPVEVISFYPVRSSLRVSFNGVEIGDGCGWNSERFELVEPTPRQVEIIRFTKELK